MTTLTILENIDNFIKDLTYVPEITFKKVVRGGVVKKVVDCPDGFKRQNGRCVRIQMSEHRKRMKAALKAKKTRAKHAHNAAFVKALEKRRAKSMKLRNLRHL